MRALAAAAGLLLVLLLVACGAKGELVLPDAPATEPAGTAPAAQPPDERDT